MRMIRQMPVQEQNIVAFRVSGRLSHADYQAFLPQLEDLMKQYGPLSILLELVDFRGWDLAAAWDDFRFAVAHPNDFQRIAIVGESALQRWMTLMAKPFTSAKIRYFAQGETSEAWNWLREPLREAAKDSLDPAPYRTVLAAIDLSPHAIRVVRRALDIAARYDATTHLVHAVDTQVFYDQAYDPVIPAAVDLESELVELATKHMKEIADKIGVANLPVSVQIGAPKDVILSQAAALRADLIVVGAYEHSGIGRLLGSTASAVAHSADCDVISVRIADKD